MYLLPGIPSHQRVGWWDRGRGEPGRDRCTPQRGVRKRCVCGVGGRWLANAFGGPWPRRAGRRIARRRGGGELVVDWSLSRRVAERMGDCVGITELRLGLAGGGWREMKSSGCLLRLAAGIERHLKM